jgi:hypothetical protein
VAYIGWAKEVHFKAVLRHNTPTGVRLLPAGTVVVISVRDGEDRAVDTRSVKVNAWSSAEWTMTLPKEGGLGGYSVRGVLEADMPKPKPPEARRPGERPVHAATTTCRTKKWCTRRFSSLPTAGLISASTSPWARLAAFRDDAHRPYHREVSFRRRDGSAPCEMDVHAIARVRRAKADPREVR